MSIDGRYQHDTDHNMTMVKFTKADGTEIGAFTWFAVHGTSMNNTNLLVSGDNKGYASYLMERAMNGPTNTSRRPLHAPSLPTVTMPSHLIDEQVPLCSMRVGLAPCCCCSS